MLFERKCSYPWKTLTIYPETIVNSELVELTLILRLPGPTLLFLKQNNPPVFYIDYGVEVIKGIYQVNFKFQERVAHLILLDII